MHLDHNNVLCGDMLVYCLVSIGLFGALVGWMMLGGVGIRGAPGANLFSALKKDHGAVPHRLASPSGKLLLKQREE